MRLVSCVFLLAAAARAAGAGLPVSPELGALAATRLKQDGVTKAFQIEVGKACETKLGLAGAGATGTGSLLAAAIRVPNGKQLAVVFGYVNGKAGSKARRWFIAFTSTGKYVPPVEVSGGPDLTVVQSVQPAGVFWALLDGGKPKTRLMHFDVENELEVKTILAANLLRTPGDPHWVSYEASGREEILIHHVPPRYAAAVAGVLTVDATKIVPSDAIVGALLSNFKSISDNFTRVKPVAFGK